MKELNKLIGRVASGMGNADGLLAPVVAPARLPWIATAIGAGVGLASSLIGGAAASRAARSAERRQRQREAEEAAWYNRRYNEDYADTAAGQNLLRRAKDFARETWRKAAGAAAVAGGTDAATAMAKEAGNKMVGDTLSNMAATDEARKASVDNAHRAAQDSFAQMDMQRELQRAQSITEASQNASNAMLQAGMALDTGGSITGKKNGTATHVTERVERGKQQLRDLNASMPWNV